MKVRRYVAKEGGRWDLVAYDAGGNPLDYERIIAASRGPIAPVFDNPTPVNIPADLGAGTVPPEKLPPWIR